MTTTTSNRLPVFAVRFDDGRENLYDDVQPFIHFKVPFTLALHYDLLKPNQLSRSSIQDIKNILKEARDAGVKVEIVQHFNSNLTSVSTYQDLKKQIDPSRLEQAFGVKVRGIAAAGGTTQIDIQTRLTAMIREIGEGFGIDWFDYSYPALTAKMTGTFSPSTFAMDTLDGTAPTSDATHRGYFPGCMADPALPPTTTNVDLGIFVVERDPSVYLASLPGHLKTRATWTSGYTNVGAGGSANNWGKTWRLLYDGAIANGCGLVVGLHEEDDGVNYGPGAGDEVNGMSYLHIAWTLRQLADAGFIRLGTQSDAVDWARCRWAPGTELMPEVQGRIPSRVIGDTAGIDTTRYEGYGMSGMGGVTWSASGSQQFGGAAGTLASPTPEELGNQPGPMSRPGSILLEQSGAAKLALIRGNLCAGRYQITLHFDHQLIGLEELGVAQIYPAMNLNDAYLDPNTAYPWVVQSLWQMDGATGWADSAAASGSRSCSFSFAIDPGSVPQLVGDLQDGGTGGTMDTSYPQPFVIGAVGFQVTTGGAGIRRMYTSLRYLGPVGA